MKKTLSFVLAVLMLMCSLPISVFAETLSSGRTGTCTWSLDENGHLTISGYGAMQDYTGADAPWGRQITSVSIKEGVTHIGAYAFKNCTKLESVVMTDSVQTMGKYAFFGCEQMTSVQLSNSITVLNQSVFGSCTTLYDIDLPDNLTAIHSGAFSLCEWLPILNIPDSVTYIGSWAFEYTAMDYDPFSYNEDNYIKTILIRAQSGVDGIYTIKEGTRLVAGGAFWNQETMTAVSIPDSVSYINADAFDGCGQLSVVYHPDGAEGKEKIIIDAQGNEKLLNALWLKPGDVAPSNPTPQQDFLYTIQDGKVTITGYIGSDSCLSIPAIIDGRLVTHIGVGAFKNNNVISSVQIPFSVEEIGADAFAGCRSLKTCQIQEGLKTIGDGAFIGSGLETINLPEGLVTIQLNAFGACENLQFLTIPDSVTYIGSCAFLNTCMDPDPFGNTGDCYVGSTLLKASAGLGATYEIKEGTRLIADSACLGQYNLATLILPDSIEYINSNAFDGCNHLSVVYHPDGALGKQTISIDAQGNEVLLNAVWLKPGEEEPPQYTPKQDLMYTIQNGEVSICGYTGIDRWLVIPPAIDGYPVTRIANGAFKNYNELYNVQIPSSVMEIGEEAFRACENLKLVEFQEGPKSIGNYAFAQCCYLESIVLPDSITQMGYNVFEQCGCLQYAKLPYYLTTIPSCTFFECFSLADITYPRYLKRVEDSAFYYSGSVPSLPKTVEYIGVNAFAHSGADLGCVPKNAALDEGAFAHCGIGHVRIPDGTEEIAPYLFGDSSISSITLPVSIKAIGEYAFDGYYVDGCLTDVFYLGTEQDRAKISIGENNRWLEQATWHYQCMSPQDQIDKDVDFSVTEEETSGCGLAFRFKLLAQGVTVDGKHKADLTNATVNYYGTPKKLVRMGVLLTNNKNVGTNAAGFNHGAVNGANVLDTPIVYLSDYDEATCTYSVRITQIPEKYKNRKIYALPYYVVEVNGEEKIIYDVVSVASCSWVEGPQKK